MSTSPDSPESDKKQDNSIRVLSGLEAIRLRPGMYIGAQPDAIYHLLDEVLDNSIQEAMVGRCNQVDIAINADSSIGVWDNGSGIRVDVHPQLGISVLEVEFTQMLIGGHPRNYPHHICGGMHGVGLKAVNAFSEWVIAEVRRDGYLWRQSFARGVPTSELIQVRPMNDGESTGTSVAFRPDAQIFDQVRKSYDFEFDTIAERCRQLAYLLPDLTIRLIDNRQADSPREATFHFADGLTAYVEYLNRDYTPIHPVIAGTNILKFGKSAPDQDSIVVEFAFQYIDDSHTTERLFANMVETPEGGTHRIGLHSGLLNTINEWAQQDNFFEDNKRFNNRDISKGLTAVVSVRHPFPQFQSQAIVMLMNPEVKPIVDSAVSAMLAHHYYYRGLKHNILMHCQPS